MRQRLIKLVFVVTISLCQIWMPAIWGTNTILNLFEGSLTKMAHAETKKKDVKKSNKMVRRFTAPKDGVITDTKTGLQWAQDAGGKEMNWDEANAYVQSLKIGGHSDWRLPTKEEFESLLTYCESKVITVGKGKCAEYYNKIGFNNLQSVNYWSSTSDASDTSYAWVFDMWGSVNFYIKSGGCYVWPVRSGQ